ncbi:MAG: D-aminoacylase [Deltaproteobacteria bacterium]|nr:D-aminoacylase [Deltaproteobacteria bacterium]
MHNSQKTQGGPEAADYYDLILKNGQVYDGNGNPPQKADVAIKADRIIAIGDVDPTQGNAVIDATGLAVAPGFIDTHTHDDLAVIMAPDLPAKVSQGVTTVIVGNCGYSYTPLKLEWAKDPHIKDFGLEDDSGKRKPIEFATFSDYTDEIERVRPAVNTAVFIGHGTLRLGAMDRIDREAEAAEISLMKERLDGCMKAGAMGLSTGLIYDVNMAANTDEIVELAKVLNTYNGIYATHMRSEGEHVTAAISETFEIGRRADVSVFISHHKSARKFPKSQETLALIDAARKHQCVGLDAYPYAATSTLLLPRFVDDDTPIMVSECESYPEMSGRYLDDIATQWGCSRQAAAERLEPAHAVYFSLDEDGVRRILSYPHTMIGSDGLQDDTHPHPRLWGTFPRVLGHYSRDIGLFPMEEAIRKMTSLPADTFGFSHRGRIETGYFADLVVFNPDTIIDRATFEDPIQPADGIERVIVNGAVTWCDGKPTGSRAGQVLKRGRDIYG